MRITCESAEHQKEKLIWAKYQVSFGHFSMLSQGETASISRPPNHVDHGRKCTHQFVQHGPGSHWEFDSFSERRRIVLKKFLKFVRRGNLDGEKRRPMFKFRCKHAWLHTCSTFPCQIRYSPVLFTTFIFHVQKWNSHSGKKNRIPEKNGILKKMEFYSRILILFNSVKKENVLYMEKQVF